MPPQQGERALDLVDLAFDIGAHGGTRWDWDRVGYVRKMTADLKPFARRGAAPLG
jgi:hypothetical protein